jgi:hypothetical protein
MGLIDPTPTVFVPYHAFDNLIMRGTRATQPLATTVTPGSLYNVTDEQKVERSSGAAWESYSASAVLPSNLAYTDVANVFTQDQTIKKATNPYYVITNDSRPTDTRRWGLLNFDGDGALYFQTQTDAGTYLSNVLTLDRAGHVALTGGAAPPYGPRLQIGGTTAAFPALRHSGATMEVVTADNTLYAQMTAGNFYSINPGTSLNDLTVRTTTNFAGGLYVSAGHLQVVAGGIRAVGNIRSEGLRDPVPTGSTGLGMEVFCQSGYGYLHCYNVTTGAYGPVQLVGSSIICSPGGITAPSATLGQNGLTNVFYPGRQDTTAAQSSWYLGSHASYGLYSNTGLYLGGSLTLGGSVTSGSGTSTFIAIQCNNNLNVGDVTVYNTLSTRTAAGCDITSGWNLFSTAPMYPGRLDTGWTKQISWYLASHGSYGLYMNTGLYLESNVWCTVVEARNYVRTAVGLYDLGRGTPIGDWIDVPFSAANFYAGAGGWTVSSVLHNRYMLVGHTLFWNLWINGTSTTAAGTNTLYCNAPNLMGLAMHASGPVFWNLGGQYTAFYCYVDPASANRILIPNVFGAGTLSLVFNLALQIS